MLIYQAQNICGMSVVKDWEKLKRFNLAQIQGGEIGSKNPGPQDLDNSAAATTEVDTVAQTAVMLHREEEAKLVT